ncbi:MAG: hypothetical protein IPM95_13850 [Sphingobacteriales bacterium]|nr:hypothetical protein [Sphingobacteriales bacterium]
MFMRKYTWLIFIFILACKKNDGDIRISTSKQPKKIQIFEVNTSSSAETLLHSIFYFYNDSTNKFDSIRVDDFLYVYDYSRLATENKILFNYSGSSAPYQEIKLDTVKYTLQYYQENFPSPGFPSTYTFQFDTATRIASYNYAGTPDADNYTKEFHLKSDSIFIHTNHPSDGCQSTDTLINGLYSLHSVLPYLLLLRGTHSCNPELFNILTALPVSNYTNKLPAKIVNGNSEIVYVYTGDTKGRLSEVSFIQKRRDMNDTIRREKIRFGY